MSRRLFGGATLAAGLAAVLIGALQLHPDAPGGRPEPVARPTVILPGRTSHAVAPAGLPADARVRLRRIGVSAPVIGVAARTRAAGSVVRVPRDPRVVGWWPASAAPDAWRGATVLVGHVNYDGEAGAFAELGRAQPGDRVTALGHRYRVTRVRRYPKTTGMPDALFGRDGPPTLVLVTCGGPFDPRSGNYEDNVVVVAAPR